MQDQNPKLHIDQQLLDRLRSNPSANLNTVYGQFRKEFLGWAKKNHNLSIDDASDLYQDTIIDLIENVRNGKLTELTSSLKTYLFAIAKRRCYKFLKAQGRKTVYDPALEKRVIEQENMNEKQNPYSKKLKEAFAKLSQGCKEILSAYYYEGANVEELMIQFGYKDKNAVSATKSRCLKKLKDLITDRL